MRTLSIILVGLAAATVLHAGDDGKADLKAMEGTWKAVIVEIDGKPAGDKEKEADFKLVIKDGKYTVFFNAKLLTRGSIKLDASKKEIDALGEEGPAKGITQKGIYEIKGDEMRIIFAEPGKDRPTSLKTREKSGEALLSYSRLKDAKKK